MEPQALSPLAFEMLKYFCNTGNTDTFQSVDRNMLGIESQQDFLNGLKELQGQGLIILSGEAGYQQEPDVEGYAAEQTFHIGNPANNGPVYVAINSAAGDVCKNMDYYLGAEQDSDELG